MIIRKVNINFFIIFVLTTYPLTNFASEKQKNITLSTKHKNYLINIKITNHKKNLFYGKMFFANLSNQNIEFMLKEDIFSKKSYKIALKYQNKKYPIFHNHIASVMISIPKGEIKSYNIISKVPQNIDWKKTQIVVNNNIIN
jgi:hypothetical protein